MIAQPDPQVVGQRALEVHTLLHQRDYTEEVDRLTAAIRSTPTCWATFTGFTLVARLDLATDTEPLLREALRLIVIRSVVAELTGDDNTAARFVGPAPVESMIHAVLAQHNSCDRLGQQLDLWFLSHHSSTAHAGYRPGDYLHHCYYTAWGQPDPRYWLDPDETRRRQNILAALYASIGIHDGGTRHHIRFDPTLPLSMAAL